MKLTIESKVVKQVVADLVLSQPVNTERSQSYVDELTADMPVVVAKTIEEADEVARQVIAWQRALPSKKTTTPVPQGRELILTIGLLMTTIDKLNFETEQMLFELGVVERGETDTQESDTA